MCCSAALEFGWVVARLSGWQQACHRSGSKAASSTVDLLPPDQIEVSPNSPFSASSCSLESRDVLVHKYTMYNVLQFSDKRLTIGLGSQVK